MITPEQAAKICDRCVQGGWSAEGPGPRHLTSIYWSSGGPPNMSYIKRCETYEHAKKNCTSAFINIFHALLGTLASAATASSLPSPRRTARTTR